GTDARPGRQMIDAKKYAHIDADLGDQHGRNQPVDARNLHQECVLRAIGLEPLANAPVERCDVRLDRFEPAQLHRQEEAVVLLDPPVERQDQIGVLSAQLALARSAIASAEASPSISARSIARPDTPKTSEATLASLMLAVSRSFSSRLRSAAWLSTSLRR